MQRTDHLLLTFSRRPLIGQEVQEYTPATPRELTTPPALQRVSPVLLSHHFTIPTHQMAATFRISALSRRWFGRLHGPPVPSTPLIAKQNLSPEQLTALKLVGEGKNVFITGRAGTGKSALIDEIIKQAHEKGQECSITAPTGVAALLVNGRTLHSWAGVCRGDKHFEYYEKRARKEMVPRLRRRITFESLIKRSGLFPSENLSRVLELLEIPGLLIIDEVSMVGCYHCQLRGTFADGLWDDVIGTSASF